MNKFLVITERNPYQHNVISKYAESPDLNLSSDALCAKHVQAGRFSPSSSVNTNKSTIKASIKTLHTNIPVKRKMRNDLRVNIPKRRSMRLMHDEVGRLDPQSFPLRVAMDDLIWIPPKTLVSKMTRLSFRSKKYLFAIF